MSWENTLETWSRGPSETEQTKCENTERAIREALNADPELRVMDTLVFTQGSYRAKTNVRQNSDVDICVLLRGQVFPDYGNELTDKDVGLSDSNFTFDKFKDMVGRALIKKFGSNNVTRGNKAFDIHENSYRVDADVVPAFEHRRYFRDNLGRILYHEGVAFKTDKEGTLIKNFPEQTYSNGVTKNTETARRYKRTIRILKRLRDYMQDNKISGAENVPSFLIESLVWNSPNNSFNSLSYFDNVKAVLTHTHAHTQNQLHVDEWGEVNELKYLFRDAQPWTLLQANKFLGAAKDFIGI